MNLYKVETSDIGYEGIYYVVADGIRAAINKAIDKARECASMDVIIKKVELITMDVIV
jgi:hypothetical protein